MEFVEKDKFDGICQVPRHKAGKEGSGVPEGAVCGNHTGFVCTECNEAVCTSCQPSGRHAHGAKKVAAVSGGKKK